MEKLSDLPVGPEGLAEIFERAFGPDERMVLAPRKKKGPRPRFVFLDVQRSAIRLPFGMNRTNEVWGDIVRLRVSRVPYLGHVVACSFDGEERLRRYSFQAIGADLFSSPGWHFLRLPFSIGGARAWLERVLCGPSPSRREITEWFGRVGELMAEKAWADFEHQARGSIGTGNWMKVQVVFKEFKKKIHEIGLPDYRSKETRRITAELRRAFIRPDRFLEVFAGKVQTGSVAELSAVSAVPLDALGAVKGRILLCEDDMVQAAALEKSLKSAGYEVRVVSDCSLGEEEVVRLVHRERTDVVILDLEFGTLGGGYHLLRALKRAGDDVKVLMLTGHGKEHIIRAKRAGADSYLLKPAMPAQLDLTLQEILVRRRVLIVDDELESILTPDLQRSLVTRRIGVVSYRSPEALKADVQGGKLALSGIDLVLLDLMFSGSLAGVEAFRWLKDRRGDLSIFILTGYGDDPTRIRVAYEELGQWFSPRDDYLVKPLAAEAWGRIWEALFPTIAKVTLSQKDQTLRVYGQSGELRAELPLSRKHSVLVYCLSLKRRRGDGIDIMAEMSQDVDMSEAHRIAGWTYNWDEGSLREAISRVNKAFRSTLGGDLNLVERQSLSTYSVVSAIGEINLLR